MQDAIENNETASPGRGETEVIQHLDEYAFHVARPQDHDSQVQEIMDRKENELLTLGKTVPEAPAESGGTLQQIIDTPYAVHTRPDGYKLIVMPRTGPGKTNAETILRVQQVQAQIDEENRANGFEVSGTDLTGLALARQALQQRQMSTKVHGKLPANHPFEISRQLKAKGVDPNSRQFRQLFKKATGNKRFG